MPRRSCHVALSSSIIQSYVIHRSSTVRYGGIKWADSQQACDRYRQMDHWIADARCDLLTHCFVDTDASAIYHTHRHEMLVARDALFDKDDHGRDQGCCVYLSTKYCIKHKAHTLAHRWLWLRVQCLQVSWLLGFICNSHPYLLDGLEVTVCDELYRKLIVFKPSMLLCTA
jgi:hypothetical protein